MEILFALIPLSIVIVTIAVMVFRWAVNSGQYDDLEGPAHSILFEDDQHMIPKDIARSSDSSESQH
jgi:cbb3-type cytochrome oxidase maturation protein